MRSRALLALATTLVVGACSRPSPLLAPSPAGLDLPAPDSFVVRFATTKGNFDVMVHRDWAARGADRVFWLARNGYYDGARFFRAVPNFVVQFGIAADPRVTAAIRTRRIADDSVSRSNVRGTLSFAAAGPNSRTTQLFINLRDNQRLDRLGFAVFGQVVAGMDVVDSLYTGYGEGAPRGKGPTQDRITGEGEPYLAREFPLLDQIRGVKVVRRYGGNR
ncbi:MAG: peptidylprolyl isomerase [Gemmatimonadota bacterium]